MRRKADVVAAEHEAFERSWFNVHCHRDVHPLRRALSEVEEEGARQAERMRQEYADLVVKDDYELGRLHGRLVTLRWVLGDDWGNLDT